MWEPPFLTRGDALWGEPCLAYHLQGRLPAEATTALARMQRYAARELSAPVHLVPAEALHVSLYSLIPVHWPEEAKEPFWNAQQARLLELLPELTRACSGLVLELESTRLFPSAVVAVARDTSGTIAALRRRLAQLFRHPTLPPPSYDLIHCTLARFATSASLPASERHAYEAHWRSFSTPLRALALVREQRYPSLEVEDIVATAL